MKIKKFGKLNTEAQFVPEGNKGFLESKSHRITTIEDLVDYCKVDMDKWAIDKVVCNKWEVGAVIDDEIIVEPLFQIKAWLKRKEDEIAMREVLDDMIKDARKHAPKYKKIQYAKSKEKHLLEISACDLHFGKLAWAAETGDDYDIKIAKSRFVEAMNALMQRASSFDVEKILFVVGNDLFNVDNHNQTTTGGTPQDEDGRWQKSFIEVRKVMIEVIDMLQNVAPVEILCVSGNHDLERLFYFGEVLSAWYSNCPNVTVDNSPLLRKYFRYGKCLLMFTHGDKEKVSSLPLIMATERPKDWGEAKHYEVHLGHRHHRKDVQFTAVDEHNGVRVRFLPSLCGIDAWHASKGYKSMKAAEAYIWHKEDGFVGHFSYTPKK